MTQQRHNVRHIHGLIDHSPSLRFVFEQTTTDESVVYHITLSVTFAT